MKFRHDYTQCMMMKLKLSEVSREKGVASKVLCTFEKALEIIKEVDGLTLGVKKIIYLVGWQYAGHDDKYPAFFEANTTLKRKSDKTACDSLRWLIEEAKKYHAVVSLHVNFTDAYVDSPLFDAYQKADALIRNRHGEPAVIERYNGRACYKISYKEEWESGLFQDRIERLLKLFPIAEAGTLHVDNFQCYVNRAPSVSAEEMQFYRIKMIDYLFERGIDITSEFTYREGKGSVLMYGRITRDVTPTRYPIALLRRIPAVWWTDKMTIKEYFEYYPHVYGGGIPKNDTALHMFYGNMHGEDEVWDKAGYENWHGLFLKVFLTVNVPFFFLNGKTRVCFTDKHENAVRYSDGTESRADGTITVGGEVVKDKNKLFLPYSGGYVAYSENGGSVSGKIGAARPVVYEITAGGLQNPQEIAAKGGIVTVNAERGKGYFIKIEKEKAQ